MRHWSSIGVGYLNEKKLLILGAGNMATALLSPLKESLQNVEIMIYTPSFTSAENLASILGGRAIDQIQDLEIDELLLCVISPSNLAPLSRIELEKLIHPLS